jgi:hypothetical protein
MHEASSEIKCLSHHPSSYAWGMRNRNERLRQARIKAGLKTASDAARSMGIPVPTYVQHENGRSPHGFPPKEAERYSKRYRVSVDWLMTGKGEGPSGETDQEEPAISDSDVRKLAEASVKEIQPGMTIGEIERTVASALHEHLGLFLADRGVVDLGDAKIARDTAAQSQPSTKRSDPAERRSA